MSSVGYLYILTTIGFITFRDGNIIEVAADKGFYIFTKSSLVVPTPASAYLLSNYILSSTGGGVNDFLFKAAKFF